VVPCDACRFAVPARTRRRDDRMRHAALGPEGDVSATPPGMTIGDRGERSCYAGSPGPMRAATHELRSFELDVKQGDIVVYPTAARQRCGWDCHRGTRSRNGGKSTTFQPNRTVRPGGVARIVMLARCVTAQDDRSAPIMYGCNHANGWWTHVRAPANMPKEPLRRPERATESVSGRGELRGINTKSRKRRRS